MLRALPRTVVMLGLVSLLTDLASEMVYPLLPLFLATVLGAGAVSLGVIEGIAEATSAALKLLSGHWSDRTPRRKPFIVAGYTASAVARPLIGLAASWPVVLGLRFLDRVGKGVRGAPRDAMIADLVAPERRGVAYGFHRAMDHAGAVLGPVLAAALLGLAGLSLREVLLAAAVPGIAVVVAVTRGVSEPARTEPRPAARRSVVPGLAPPPLRRLLAALGLFALGNSADAFLLLALGEAGLAASAVALCWSGHHLVKMVAALAGGRWSDRFGGRPVLAAGWLVYAGVYAVFAVADGTATLVVTFLVYGLALGLAEPAERVLVAGLAPGEARGAAFGAVHGLTAIAALPASLLVGGLWSWRGAGVAFGVGSVLALAAVVVLATVRLRADGPSSRSRGSATPPGPDAG